MDQNFSLIFSSSFHSIIYYIFHILCIEINIFFIMERDWIWIHGKLIEIIINHKIIKDFLHSQWTSRWVKCNNHKYYNIKLNILMLRKNYSITEYMRNDVLSWMIVHLIIYWKKQINNVTLFFMATVYISSTTWSLSWIQKVLVDLFFYHSQLLTFWFIGLSSMKFTVTFPLLFFSCNHLSHSLTFHPHPFKSKNVICMERIKNFKSMQVNLNKEEDKKLKNQRRNDDDEKEDKSKEKWCWLYFEA